MNGPDERRPCIFITILAWLPIFDIRGKCGEELMQATTQEVEENLVAMLQRG